MCGAPRGRPRSLFLRRRRCAAPWWPWPPYSERGNPLGIGASGADGLTRGPCSGSQRQPTSSEVTTRRSGRPPATTACPCRARWTSTSSSPSCRTRAMEAEAAAAAADAKTVARGAWEEEVAAAAQLGKDGDEETEVTEDMGIGNAGRAEGSGERPPVPATATMCSTSAIGYAADAGSPIDIGGRAAWAASGTGTKWRRSRGSSPAPPHRARHLRPARPRRPSPRCPEPPLGQPQPQPGPQCSGRRRHRRALPARVPLGSRTWQQRVVAPAFGQAAGLLAPASRVRCMRIRRRRQHRGACQAGGAWQRGNDARTYGTVRGGQEGDAWRGRVRGGCGTEQGQRDAGRRRQRRDWPPAASGGSWRGRCPTG